MDQLIIELFRKIDELKNGRKYFSIEKQDSLSIIAIFGPNSSHCTLVNQMFRVRFPLHPMSMYDHDIKKTFGEGIIQKKHEKDE